MRYDSDTQSMSISKAIHIWSVLFPAPAHSSQVSSSSWISGRQSPTKESSPVSCALSCFNLEQLTPCSCNAIMYIRWRAWSPNVGQKKVFYTHRRETMDCVRGIASLPVEGEPTEEVYLVPATGKPGYWLKRTRFQGTIFFIEIMTSEF